MKDDNGNFILDDEKDDLIPDHNYDGIQELSRDMPMWLTMIFFSTVTCGLLYMLFMASGGFDNQAEELQAKMKFIEKKQSLESQIEPPTSDPGARLEAGRIVFENKCSVCHGQSGEGGIGPNLTDDFWIHGDGKITGIENVVKVGVPDKGMPNWQNSLRPQELKDVVTFVSSLSGTNAPNGKSPEGRRVAASGRKDR